MGLAENQVTCGTKETANPARRMTVIHREHLNFAIFHIGLRLFTDSTKATLFIQQGLVLAKIDPIFRTKLIIALTAATSLAITSVILLRFSS